MEMTSHPGPSGPHFWGMRLKDGCYPLFQTPGPEVYFVSERLSQLLEARPLTGLLQDCICEVTGKLLWEVG